MNNQQTGLVQVIGKSWKVKFIVPIHLAVIFVMNEKPRRGD